jgi:hypothetical protein
VRSAWSCSAQEVTPDYKDSSHLETYKLAGGVPGSILVPPGQQGLRVSTWSDLLREVSTGKSSIVLHVVSWGMNQIGSQDYSDLSSHVAGMDLAAAAAAYFETERDHEVTTLDSFAGQISLTPRRLSLITVVTKQDLWWEDRQDVRTFYERGRYAEIVAGIRNRVGEQNFTHKIWSASLLRRNIVDMSGNILRATAAGYDDTIQLRDQCKLLDLIRKEVEHG